MYIITPIYCKLEDKFMEFRKLFDRKVFAFPIRAWRYALRVNDSDSCGQSMTRLGTNHCGALFHVITLSESVAIEGHLYDGENNNGT